MRKVINDEKLWLTPPVFLLLLGIAAWTVFPWYAQIEGLLSFGWLSDFTGDSNYASAAGHLFLGEKSWLTYIGFFLGLQMLAVVYFLLNKEDFENKKGYSAKFLLFSGGLSIIYILAQGFIITNNGIQFDLIRSFFPEMEENQYGMGWGGFLCLVGAVGLTAYGISGLKKVHTEFFTILVTVVVISIVGAFIVFPLFHIFVQGFINDEGDFSVVVFLQGLIDQSIWRALKNSIMLALFVAVVSTFLGFVMALSMERVRSGFFKKSKIFLILPLITPPFVVGLAIILLFGRSGAVTTVFADIFGISASRYIYGFSGVALAQIVSLTPLATLSISAILNGIGPSLEEASSTLGANTRRTFFRVTVPLALPGIAAAFLLIFIESLADFGNPLVLGGEFEVLSTEIFFSIVGAQYNLGRASILSVLLMLLTMSLFFYQRFHLSKRAYVTVQGKGDSGNRSPLPPVLLIPVVTISLAFMLFTVVIYSMIIFGGFVKTWGYDHSFTLEHYIQTFDLTTGAGGLVLSGLAWDSLITTMQIAFIAAPLTAIVGIAAAWLFARTEFRFKGLVEFATMMSFAIPGTVLGVSYILAFNTPPFELTGTGTILLICFIFRNMPVGLQSGKAALSQIDKSLDEAASILGSKAYTVFYKIILPLIRPSIFNALSYGFITSITSISAVIFLVSARFNLATVYIIGRLENGDYGIAIVYSSMLIVIMAIVLLIMNMAVGQSTIFKKHT